MKKIFVVTYVMLVVCLAMPATTWGGNEKKFDNGGGDSLWTNPLNWDPDGLPTVVHDKVEMRSAVMLDSGTHSINGLEIYGDGTLIQTGGILNIAVSVFREVLRSQKNGPMKTTRTPNRTPWVARFAVRRRLRGDELIASLLHSTPSAWRRRTGRR